MWRWGKQWPFACLSFLYKGLCGKHWKLPMQVNEPGYRDSGESTLNCQVRMASKIH